MIAKKLTDTADNSISVAVNGEKDAEKGLNNVIASEQMLNNISLAVKDISSMSEQMAAAVEQQAIVSEQVNNQVKHIAELAEKSYETANQSSESISVSKNVSDQLHELVNRFK